MGTGLSQGLGAGARRGPRGDEVVHQHEASGASGRSEGPREIFEPLGTCELDLVAASPGTPKQRANLETAAGSQTAGKNFGVIESSTPDVTGSSRDPGEDAPQDAVMKDGPLEGSFQGNGA